jgi:hypothetical protein
MYLIYVAGSLDRDSLCEHESSGWWSPLWVSVICNNHASLEYQALVDRTGCWGQLPSLHAFIADVEVGL